LAVFSVTSASAVDFASLMGKTENIFPEKYDEELSRLYRPEDRIVFIFREMTQAQFNQSQNVEAQLNDYLKKALNRYWLLESIEYKRAFLADEVYFSKRIQKYLQKLPCTYDQAAFAVVLSELENKNGEIKPLAMSSQKTLQNLKVLDHQKKYASQIKNSKDFYRRIPFFLKPAIKLEEKIDSLIEKLQHSFILENMILAVDSLIEKNDGKLREGLVKLKEKLAHRLYKKIIENLENQIEAGLEEDAVTGIARSSQGILIRQVLYQGRIRTFVKEMQKAENMQQLSCFIPILAKIRSSISGLRNRISDSRSRATLEKMYKNLDEMTTIMKLKLRNKKEDSQAFKKLVEQFDHEISISDHRKILLEM
jgi:hypothetical protein